ncbi:MAG: 2-amino-4-hydroxy-6-hydroxymethyldihydropteridine diphosphokinase [Moraxellaceae bacterium]|nr:2-amino-4-hydroxy-6-hydroxymethyldihydropteridine diphosphokinase [Moraxellaceae bacterium]
MPRVYLSLGSNIEREKNIRAALRVLEDRFGDLLVSPVYESEAVGFEGDHFLNLVVGFDTEKPVRVLAAELRAIEEANGRDRRAPKFSARTLDIDILTWGNACGEVDGVSLPRDEILKNAFVLLPLSEIAGNDRHPETLRSYHEHWEAYDKHKQKLWRVDFSWGSSE